MQVKCKDRRYGKMPYAAVCRFRRQGSFFYSENHLESGGIRGNMLTRRFGFVLIVVSCNLWEFRAMGFDRIPHNPI